MSGIEYPQMTEATSREMCGPVVCQGAWRGNAMSHPCWVCSAKANEACIFRSEVGQTINYSEPAFHVGRLFTGPA